MGNKPIPPSDLKYPKNGAEKVRRVLFNFDLELTASLGELSIAKAKVQRYSTKKNKREIQCYTSASIDEIKLNVYIDQLTNGKNETFEALEDLLNTYNAKYKKIWLMFFIGHQTYEDIAANTHYSYNNVRKIISRLRQDLIDYGAIAEDTSLQQEKGENQ